MEGEEPKEKREEGVVLELSVQCRSMWECCQPKVHRKFVVKLSFVFLLFLFQYYCLVFPWIKKSRLLSMMDHV